jgi:asparagine synthase (glutamine-hydrolysing)
LIIPGLYGRIGRVGDEPEPAALQGIASRLAATPDSVQLLQCPGCAVAVVSGHGILEDGLCCAVSGNVDWLDYELADVQLKRGPARALHQAYRRFGKAALDKIGGRFSVCVWDAEKRSGWVACDRFGQMPVFWSAREDGGVDFAPTSNALMAVAGTAARLSDQGIFNYLYFHMVPGPGTVYTGVNKLMAAEALVAREGDWRPERYWLPDFRENEDAPQAEAAEEMLGLLSSSVARLAHGADSGAFLSGGLDSSTVAGLLARHQPHPKTYSIGFDAEGYDEIAFARLASERFDTDFQTYYVTPDDVVNALPTIAAAYDEPFGNSSALPTYFCARMAIDDGRTRLLAGDGGDELFAGNERYAKQTVFENYHELPRWLRRGLLEPLICRLAPQQVGVFRKARSYIDQANIPLPDRLRTYNFLNRLGLETIMQPDFMHSVETDYPARLEREIYHQPARASRLNRMLYLDWQHTLMDNDLRKVTRMCQLADIEVEYPMLDDRLVDFSTRVSSRRKMRRNRLRHFYKRAVKGFLPHEIIHKTKHGFGLPFGVWMAEHPGLQELARANLERMQRRRYVRPDFIEHIARLHREQHAGYYGEMIWVLIMLELWLTAQGVEP